MEHLGTADHRGGRERPAVGPAVDPDPAPVQVGEVNGGRVERGHLIVQRGGEGVADTVFAHAARGRACRARR